MRAALAAAVLLALAVAPPAGAASVDLQATAFGVTWTPASGPVAGYRVLSYRSTSPTPPTAAQLATENDVGAVTVYPVSGAVGDYITLAVRAYDAAGNLGPLSPLSDTWHLTGVAAPVPLGSAGAPTITVRCTDPANPHAKIQPDGTIACGP